METLPKRIVLVGGGYIAAEFSHIAARAGAQVTILQHGERMLKHFDPDLVGWLRDKFRELGIEVRTETEVTAIEKTHDGYRVEGGCQWRMLPTDFPPASTVRGYFYYWRDSALFSTINDVLVVGVRELDEREASRAMADFG